MFKKRHSKFLMVLLTVFMMVQMAPLSYADTKVDTTKDAVTAQVEDGKKEDFPADESKKDSKDEAKSKDTEKSKEESKVDKPVTPKEAADAEDVVVNTLQLTFDRATGSKDVTVVTGDKTNAILTFGLGSNVANGQLGLRVKLPKGVKLDYAEFVEFKVTRGSELNPTTPDPEETAFDYYWITNTKPLASGSSRDIEFRLTPFATGVTADGSKVDVVADAFQIKENVASPINGSDKAVITAKTDSFKWTEPSSSHSVSGGSLTTKNVTISEFAYSTYVRSQTSKTGGAYANKIVYENRVIVPVDDSNKAMIKFKIENILDSNRQPVATDRLSNVSYDSDGNIRSFTIKTEVTNSNPNQEFTNNTGAFYIKGATINPDQIVNQYNLSPGDTKTLELTHEPSKATIYPLVKTTEYSESNPLVVTSPNTYKTSVTFTNQVETGEETNSTLEKKIVRLGGVDTTNTDYSKLSGYDNDLITYTLGSNFRNRQEGTLKELRFTEYANKADENGKQIGFNTDEIRFDNLKPGILKQKDNVPFTNTTLDIVVSFEGTTDTLSKSYSAQDLNELADPNGERYKAESLIRDPKDERVVKKIEYIYKNVESGAYISTAPRLTYKILARDLVFDNTKVTNNAEMTYNYMNKNFTNTSKDAYFSYKSRKFIDEDGSIKDKKEGFNFNDDRFQRRNDVIRFTINIENDKIDPIKIKTIEDFYTKNMSLYNGAHSVFNDNSSKDIEPIYLQQDNDANLVMWNPQDPTQRLETQPGFTITSDTNVDSSLYHLMKIEFDDEVVLQPNETLKLTYTMYVNDTYIADTAIGNRYTAFDGPDAVATGEYWRARREPGDWFRNINKDVINASSSKTTELPVENDYLIYTLLVKNDTVHTWYNPTIEDTYTNNVELAYDTPITDEIRPEVLAKYPVNDDIDSKLHLAVGVNDKNEQYLPEGVDVSQITTEVNEDHNHFIVKMPNSVIKPGEELRLIYAVKVKENIDTTILSNRKIVNRFTTKAYPTADSTTPIDVLFGRNELALSPDYGKIGDVSVVKSAQPLNDAKINGLIHGDEIRYKITASNYLSRENRIVKVKNVMDFVPDSIDFKEDTLKVYTLVTPENEGYVDVEANRTVVDPSLYDVTYDATTRKILVAFKDSFEIPGLNVDGTTKNREHVQLIVEFDAKVNTTNTVFGPEELSVSRVNTAGVYYTQPATELLSKSGQLISKHEIPEEFKQYDDNDPETKSFIIGKTQSAILLNQNILYGNVLKKVNPYVHDVGNNDTNTRTYKIHMQNLSFVTLEPTHLVDLLPKYETIDTTKDVIVYDSKNPDAVKHPVDYVTDTVTIEGKEYNRIQFTNRPKDDVDHIAIEGITKFGEMNEWVLEYSTVVDKETALSDFYEQDIYLENQVNRIAMYTEKEMIVRAQSSYEAALKQTNDDQPETNWDSNPDTKIRYVNSTEVRNVAQSIVPFVNVQSQWIRISGDQEEYINYSNGQAINPGSVVAWKVNFGNGNTDDTPDIVKGSYVTLELPVGSYFAGYRDNTLPSYLEEVDGPFVVGDSQKRLLVWRVKENLPKGTVKEFTVRSTTQEAKYETYEAGAEFIPLNQRFIESKVRNWARFQPYSFEPDYGDRTHIGSDLVGEAYLVKSRSQVDVFGSLGIGASLKVTDKTNSSNVATSYSRPYTIKVPTSASEVRYTMQFDVKNSAHKVSDISLVNRLARIDDTYVLRDEKRDSLASMNLVGDGDFEILLVDNNLNSVTRTFDPSEYTVQYAFESPNYIFTENDFEANGSDIWKTAQEITDGGLSFEDVTAVRVLMNSDIELESGQSVRANFTTSLEEAFREDWFANDSFAYRVRLGDTLHVNAETRNVGVNTNVQKDRLVINTKVIDPALVPLRTTFDVDVIAKDGDTEVARVPLTIDVMKAGFNLSSIDWVEALSRDYTYTIEPKHYEQYRAPKFSVSSIKDRTGLTTYTVDLEYERIIYDEVKVDVNVVNPRQFNMLNEASYTIQKFDATGTMVDEFTDTLTIDANQSATMAYTTFETGFTYKLIPNEEAGYRVTVESSEETLDTTGIRHHFVITYQTQYTDSAEVNVKVINHSGKNLLKEVAYDFYSEQDLVSSETLKLNNYVGSRDHKDLMEDKTYSVKPKFYERYKLTMTTDKQENPDGSIHWVFNLEYEEVDEAVIFDAAEVNIEVENITGNLKLDNVSYDFFENEQIIDTQNLNVVNNTAQHSYKELQTKRTYSVTPKNYAGYTTTMSQDKVLNADGSITWIFNIKYTENVPVKLSTAEVNVKVINKSGKNILKEVDYDFMEDNAILVSETLGLTKLEGHKDYSELNPKSIYAVKGKEYKGYKLTSKARTEVTEEGVLHWIFDLEYVEDKKDDGGEVIPPTGVDNGIIYGAIALVAVGAVIVLINRKRNKDDEDKK